MYSHYYYYYIKLSAAGDRLLLREVECIELMNTDEVDMEDLREMLAPGISELGRGGPTPSSEGPPVSCPGAAQFVHGFSLYHCKRFSLKFLQHDHLLTDGLHLLEVSARTRTKTARRRGVFCIV